MIGAGVPRHFAFFGHPAIGGPYRVYRELRQGLSRFGIAVHWISVGPDTHVVAERPEWLPERAFGEVLAPHTHDESVQARALQDHLERVRYDAIFVNVLADRVQTNVVRYLDPHIRRIMIVHNITAGTYAAARAIRDYVHATVAVSPRIRNDLVRWSKFPPQDTYAVANAHDVTSFAAPVRGPSAGPLRLLSLGRIEDASKGIFWLPSILRHLHDIPVILTVAGDGPDAPALRRHLAPYADRVRFIGPVSPETVSVVMAEHDVFLFPSRYEGHPIALVEALASGCVPVASGIAGVTDFTVEHGVTGFLFPIGKPHAAALFVRRLTDDRAMLARMSRAARDAAIDRFSPDRMIASYMEVIQKVFTSPRQIAPPLRAQDWRLPAGLQPGWRSALPEPIKNRLRVLRERLIAP